MSRILIVERSDSGHRLVYIAILVRAALGRGDSVTVLLPRSLEWSEAVRLHLGASVGRPGVWFVYQDFPWSLTAVSRMAEQFDCDLVVVPDADEMVMRRPAGQRLQPPVVGLIMRDPALDDASGDTSPRQRARSAALRIARHRRGLRLVTLGQYGESSRVGRRVAWDPLIAAAGLSQTRANGASLRIELGLDPDRHWIAMVGGLSRRKHVPLVARAVSQLQQVDRVRAGLLLYGPIHPDLAACADDLVGQLPKDVAVVVADGVKSNEEINAAVSLADCVAVARDLPYPNSTVVKAAAFGVPSVLAGPRILQAKTFELEGVHQCSLRQDEIVLALGRALEHGTFNPTRTYDDAQFSEALLSW